MAVGGDMDGGCKLMAEVVREKGGRWIETLRRLAMVDRVPADVAAAIEARLSATAGST
jgi:glycine cleavage system regulatory protein